jgi:hypothetical protein
LRIKEATFARASATRAGVAWGKLIASPAPSDGRSAALDENRKGDGLIAIGLGTVPSYAEKCVALVIGNDRYPAISRRLFLSARL